MLEAARDNLTAFLALLDDVELEPQALGEAAASYSIEELLKLAADARAARSAAAEEQLEVDREKRVLDGTTRHRDAVFDDYVDAAAGDDRFLAGLRLLQARSAKAISTRRLALLTKRSELANAYATGHGRAGGSSHGSTGNDGRRSRSQWVVQTPRCQRGCASIKPRSSSALRKLLQAGSTSTGRKDARSNDCSRRG